MRFIVTAPEGRYIPGFGSRECGEAFEVNDNYGQRLLDVPGLRLEPPVTSSESDIVSNLTLPESEDHPDWPDVSAWPPIEKEDGHAD